MTIEDGTQPNGTEEDSGIVETDVSLPCRGCTRECSLSKRCKRKPWRLSNVEEHL